jgi:AraC family transcriptional regulator of adaptative response/methylated-DNA-[protein]-cysteine methyltransferase
MEEEIFWKAVKMNDARFNGAFVYGVASTKIYCKPSCASRQPKRENVKYFESWEFAEKNGFRECKRCAPKAESVNSQTEMVLRACKLLENEEWTSLETLAKELDLSPSHFQKIFTQIIGISPKKFAAAKRLSRFKGELKRGNDVSSAIYEAGFGSSSRLYENVSAKLGMTPAVYKKGGKGMKIEFTIIDCELGKLLVARTEKGICSVTFGDSRNGMLERLVTEFWDAEICENNSNLKEFVEAILGNLDGSRKILDLPLDLQATAFQMRVWEVLRKIPYGETLSYQEVAEKLGNKNAVRAVASACASNRIALVIPCHRVVRSNGKLSGYRWGAERKKQILEKEKR